MMHQRPLTSQGSVPSVGGQGEVLSSPSLGQALGKGTKKDACSNVHLVFYTLNHA